MSNSMLQNVDLISMLGSSSAALLNSVDTINIHVELYTNNNNKYTSHIVSKNLY